MADDFMRAIPTGNTTDALWQDARFPQPVMPGPRLFQGPFSIADDDGWRLASFTPANTTYYANPGMGFIGYAWEESGPSLAARAGEESLEAHVDALLALPFVDILYIRCDWRDVQTEPGRLSLSPIWDVALRAVQQHGKRLAFRIQASNTVGQPGHLALPDFLREKVPYTLVNGGMFQQDNPEGFWEPRYDHPAFIEALTELSMLLAERFDHEEYLEFVDLMMYGFWGEGHTNDYPNPIPFPECEKVFLRITEAQRRAFVKTPLCVNVQTDISRAGNRAVQDYAMRTGMYLRTDSIMVNEPQSKEHDDLIRVPDLYGFSYALEGVAQQTRSTRRADAFRTFSEYVMGRTEWPVVEEAIALYLTGMGGQEEMQQITEQYEVWAARWIQ